MTTFSELGLSAGLLAAVTNSGYSTPTPIQEKAIPLALAGRDILGIAQTGTGKTAAFALPLIDRLASGRSKARMPRALVLTPTRELAAQVAEAFAVYGKGARLNFALLIGGVGMADQIAALARGVDVVIATPGRLLDLFERGNVLLTGVQFLVVDEADRMLDMGFIPDIERIFRMTPPGRQTLFFSATMPPEITRLTEAFLNQPERIEVARPASTAETIRQVFARISRSDGRMKRAALRHLITEAIDLKNGIVFCNRKSDVDIVAKSLQKHGLNAAPIHGDLTQALRTRTLDRFRSGELTLLVASDVAARGLDIADVSHVFNYDVPIHAEDYVHRIGRTGRAGRTGVATMLVGPADSKALASVMKLIRKDVEEVVLDIDAPEPEPNRGARERKGGRTGTGARPANTATSGKAEGKVAAGRKARISAETESAGTRVGTKRGRTKGGNVVAQAGAHQAHARPDRARTESIRSDVAPTASSRRESTRPERIRTEPARAPRDKAGDLSDKKGFGTEIPAFLRVAPKISA